MNQRALLHFGLLLVVFQTAATLPLAAVPEAAISPAGDPPSAGLGAIEGTILDDITRAPLVGAHVEAYTLGSPSGSHGAVTDSSGRYRLRFLPVESYYIVASHQGYRKEVFPGAPFSSGVQAGRLVNVLPDRTATGIDFELTLLGSISGRIEPKDPLQRLERCTVYLWRAGDNGWDPPPANAACAEDGSFLATGLEAGAYLVGVHTAHPFAPAIYGIGSCNWDLGFYPCDLAAATRVPVEVGETTGGIDLTLERGGRLFGQVDFVGDAPRAPVQVMLYQDDGQLVDVRYVYSPAPAFFDFWELAPGSYRLTAAGGSSWQSQALGGAACSRWHCPPARSRPVAIEAGGYRPGVDFTLEAIQPYPGCQPSAEKLCLNLGRFEVKAAWRDFIGRTGKGQAVPFNDLSGSFYFFSENNIEVVVKALNGCSSHLGHHLWIFGAGLTDVEVGLEVRDTVTGATKTYTNALGNIFLPILDIGAFDTCDALEPVSTATAVEIPAAPASPAACRDDYTGRSLCLAEGRFRVSAQFAERGWSYAARPKFLSADSVAFSFFDADNIELMVKVLSTCGSANPGHWVFATGLTDVETVITVEDVVTGQQRDYRSGPGPFAPIYDSTTFGPASCGG
jgi:hypothetical protein